MKGFKAYLQAQDKSKSTIAHYHRYVLDFLAWLDQDHTDRDWETSKGNGFLW